MKKELLRKLATDYVNTTSERIQATLRGDREAAKVLRHEASNVAHKAFSAGFTYDEFTNATARLERQRKAMAGAPFYAC